MRPIRKNGIYWAESLTSWRPMRQRALPRTNRTIRSQHSAPPDEIRKAIRHLSLQKESGNLSMGIIRGAYFKAAKECHPDSSTTCQSMSEAELNERFLHVTEAYELLQKNFSSIDPLDGNKDSTKGDATMGGEVDYITKTQEQHFRESCREVLGLDAETVEESKRCPLFREWLKGRTDAAFYWNTFFMLNGGLAPMLNTNKTMRISEGTGKVKRRRRRI